VLAPRPSCVIRPLEDTWLDFPRVRFHDLRHGHTTQLLLAGVHPKVAQERLGHATVTTALDLYSHVTATMQEDAAGRLDTAFRAAIKACGEPKWGRPVAISATAAGQNSLTL
jgi:hypothetical protein